MSKDTIDREGRYTPSAQAALDLAQFRKLLEADPPLTSRQIAHRMAMSQRETRNLLNTFGDKRK